MLNIIQTLNGWLTDYILIFLLVGVGLWFTIKTRFVQVRCFGEGMRKVFGGFSLRGGKKKGGLSSFQALATAIAAQVGTGNIVGASGAILVGGPGAIFWMWIIAFLGMATIYSEAVLAQETRVVDENGEVVGGGPVYYIKKAFSGKFGKFLAVFFAVATTLALGFMGSMVQSNSIAESIGNIFSLGNINLFGYTVPTIGVIVGGIVALIAAFIFIGGIQRIASVTEKIVPLMAGLFLLGGLVVLCINIKSVPGTFAMIFKYAFTPNALIGGGIGAALKIAISQGAKRGLFSNEAGMGSTPHAHAMAKVDKPHDQGVAAMIGVFIDTFVVLTMTALVVITCLYNGDKHELANTIENEAIVVSVDTFENGTVKTNDAYETNLYKLATGQENSNVVAELVVQEKIAFVDNTANLTDAELVDASTVAPADKNVEDLVAFAGANLKTSAKNFATVNSDNKLSADEAVNILIENKCITDVNYVSKTDAMQQAFSGNFGSFGNIFVAVCLLFFAFSTIISWNFFGKVNVQYLCGKKAKVGVVIYSIVAVCFVFLGAILKNDLVWELTDFFNYLMVLPNAIALIALTGVVTKSAKTGIAANKEAKKNKK